MDNLNHEEYSKMILALQQEKEKLKIVAEMTANLVFEYHIDENTMLYTNYNAKWNLEPCVTNYTDFLLNSDIIFEKDRNRAKEFCRQLQIGQKEIHAILRRKFNNDYRWVEVAAKTIFDEMQQPSVVIGKITDIDERKKKEILLEKMSKIDSLTNLYNQATIRQEIIQALRNRNARDLSALFIIDIDYFKQINDQYGHLFGDAVLVSVAENLLNIFGKRALVGRIGGDEFIAYLPNTSRMEVESLANDFGKKLCDDFKDRLKEFKLKVTASIGIAFSIGKDKFYEDFFIEADKALYYVKNIGKHGYEIYDGSDKYVSKEQLINQLDLNTSIIPQEGDSESSESMHNILIFAMELLEKYNNTMDAVNLILERVGKYFELDAITLSRKDSGFEYGTGFQWSQNEANYFENIGYVLKEEDLAKIRCKYNDYGIAELHVEDIPFIKEHSENINSILTTACSVNLLGFESLSFLSYEKNKQWSSEHKTIIKGLASIFCSSFSKMYALETIKNTEYMLRFDNLTGLPNYTTFQEFAKDIIETNKEKDFALIYVDFSNFQYINNTYGYTVGDHVLVSIGKWLQADFAYYECCARVTGDQFILLVTGQNIEKIRNEFIACCKRFSLSIEKECGISDLIIVSGLAKIENNQEHSLGSLIDNANLARKSLKLKSETDCMIFTKELKQHADDKAKIIASLPKALADEEFKVFLQPKINLSNNEVVGAEALVRWIRKDGSIIYPDKFIPLLEENGAITKIDFYVLERVLIYLRKRMEVKLPLIPISVNFSRKHQESSQFVSDIMALIAEYDIDSSYIEIEITESTYMNDILILNHNINLLRENKLKVSIDDFGSGFSSLNVLASAPADIIKIDRLFLEGSTERDDKILKYLIQMIKSLGFAVIAEGVETDKQVELLKSMQCDMAQGYFFARPMPLNDFDLFLIDYIS